MDTKQGRWRQWLRKKGWVLALGVVGLALLVLFGFASIRRYQAATPIASIKPEVRLPGESPPEQALSKEPSRLERYHRELEEVKKENARRRRTMETIVAMDFGRMSREAPAAERSADSTAVPETAVKPPTAQHSRIEEAVESDLQSPANPRPARSRQQPVGHAAPARREEAQADPFYTVRPQQSAVVVPQEQQGLFRAVVHGDQQLQPQATLLLRLLEEMQVGKQRFPRNSLLYGKLSGSGGGRIKIRILRVDAVPVRMQVYDHDYQEGIFYRQEEPLPSALAESREDAMNQLLHAVPYGGVAGGLAGLGRSFLRKNRKDKSLFLADGYPLFVAPEPQ
ncbi:conjugative transposon protein TraM [Cesiribacter sp. SM1]|uniref:conjugative transposon protein TraM n=1 Tax=Cesiribacter sp. SM1 TaxID=2861196 RepID=UPI001CD1EC3C|nr:conjugative transposon protein TraM [Cesiribacter sp. SM1]